MTLNEESKDELIRLQSETIDRLVKDNEELLKNNHQLHQTIKRRNKKNRYHQNLIRKYRKQLGYRVKN